MPDILMVVHCGKRKIWDTNPGQGLMPARETYVGAPFTVNRSYAERFGTQLRILSARYGLIPPNFIIPCDYDVAFTNPASRPIGIADLRRQVAEQALDRFGVVIALGGKVYTDRMREARPLA